MKIGEPLGPQHVEAVQRFFADLPDQDVTFIKEEVREPQVVAEFASAEGQARRWVVMQDGEVTAYAALHPSVGLSRHVGELRLAVAAGHRRKGLGRELAQAVVLEGLQMGLSKVVVEVVAEQEGTAEMFRRLGFEGEALLRDQLCDRNGQLRDVLVLAHFAEDSDSALRQIGADEPH